MAKWKPEIWDKVLYGNRPCTVMHVYGESADLRTEDGFKLLGIKIERMKPYEPAKDRAARDVEPVRVHDNEVDDLIASLTAEEKAAIPEWRSYVEEYNSPHPGNWGTPKARGIARNFMRKLEAFRAQKKRPAKDRAAMHRALDTVLDQAKVSDAAKFEVGDKVIAWGDEPGVVLEISERPMRGEWACKVKLKRTTSWIGENDLKPA